MRSEPETHIASLLADRLGAEDVVVLANAAGAVLAAAAALTAGRQAGARALLIQAGHVVTVGAPLDLLAAMAGAELRPVGTVERCTEAQIAAALAAGAAGAAFVLRAPPVPGLLDLPRWLWACHGAGLAVLAVAPATADIEALLDAGADLVATDAAALGFPAAGVLAGRADLVAAAGALLDDRLAPARAPLVLLEALRGALAG